MNQALFYWLFFCIISCTEDMVALEKDLMSKHYFRQLKNGLI